MTEQEAQEEKEEATMSEVQELGEDGGSWMVTGAPNEQAAVDAVRSWLNEICEGDEHLDEMLADLDSAKCIESDKWWWEPVTPEHPNSEAWLRGVDDHNPTGQPTFSGIWVMA